jgi:5-methyltetrahydrofolate--homocysteine methyltransferase
MTMGEVLTALQTAVRDGDQTESARLVRTALAAGVPPAEILADGLIPGMQRLGDLFKDGQAFLPEILISARAMSLAMEELRPHLGGVATPDKGTVVLGTVEGDLHDIGKRLVGMLLDGNGFAVVDLGVDVSAEAFVEAAREQAADVVALSALLTTTTPQFGNVIAALAAADLRDTVKVMIGGAPVTAESAAEVGADGFAADCVAAVDEATRLVADKRGR